MRIKLYCPDCDRAYSWDTDSIEHINSVHCIYCGRKFHMDSIVKRIYRGVEDAACQFFAQQIIQNNASHKIAKQMAKAFCNIHLKKMPKSMVMKKCGRGWMDTNMTPVAIIIPKSTQNFVVRQDTCLNYSIKDDCNGSELLLSEL